MEGKTDTANFLVLLKNLCLDYQAFRHIAKHSQEPERWAIFLNDYRKANQSRVFALFDELSASLQSEEQDNPVFESLSEVLVEVLL